MEQIPDGVKIWKVPKDVFDKLKDAGMDDEVDELGLHQVNFRYQSEPWDIFHEWFSSLEDDADPQVAAVWGPPIPLIGPI